DVQRSTFPLFSHNRPPPRLRVFRVDCHVASFLIQRSTFDVQRSTFPSSTFSSSSSSVGQRHRKDPAVEKIIYVPRRRVTISRHRAQIAAIDFIVTAAWEKEADPGGYNDVIGKERTVLQTEAAIQPEIVTRMVSEQHLLCNLSCRRPNI